MKDTVLKLWKKYSYLVMIIILLVGLIQPVVVLAFVICMIGPMLTGYSSGRFWCGNICPIGNFFDNVSTKVSRKNKVPVIFKSIYTKIIAAIIMMTMFVFDMKSAWGNTTLGGMVYFQMIMESIIIGTLLALLFNHRAWCYFCPMGSMGALAAKFSKKKKVLEVSNSCVNCGRCAAKCPMGLTPSSFKGGRIESLDCIQCGGCKNICLSNSINYKDICIGSDLEKLKGANTLPDNSKRRRLERNLVVSLIFTLILLVFSLNKSFPFIINPRLQPEKFAVMQLILASVILLTSTDFFEAGFLGLIKRSPSYMSVITVGVIAWYAYGFLVVYLTLIVNVSYVMHLDFLVCGIIVTLLNLHSYMKNRVAL